jgi:hypothetical protein
MLRGGNNSGKSTVVEALTLLFGRDRLIRDLTEHDFYGSDPGESTPLLLPIGCKSRRMTRGGIHEIVKRVSVRSQHCVLPFFGSIWSTIGFVTYVDDVAVRSATSCLAVGRISSDYFSYSFSDNCLGVYHSHMCIGSASRASSKSAGVNVAARPDFPRLPQL